MSSCVVFCVVVFCRVPVLCFVLCFCVSVSLCVSCYVSVVIVCWNVSVVFVSQVLCFVDVCLVCTDVCVLCVLISVLFMFPGGALFPFFPVPFSPLFACSLELLIICSRQAPPFFTHSHCCVLCLIDL